MWPAGSGQSAADPLLLRLQKALKSSGRKAGTEILEVFRELYIETNIGSNASYLSSHLQDKDQLENITYTMLVDPASAPRVRLLASHVLRDLCRGGGLPVFLAQMQDGLFANYDPLCLPSFLHLLPTLAQKDVLHTNLPQLITWIGDERTTAPEVQIMALVTILHITTRHPTVLSRYPQHISTLDSTLCRWLLRPVSQADDTTEGSKGKASSSGSSSSGGGLADCLQAVAFSSLRTWMGSAHGAGAEAVSEASREVVVQHCLRTLTAFGHSADSDKAKGGRERRAAAHLDPLVAELVAEVAEGMATAAVLEAIRCLLHLCAQDAALASRILAAVLRTHHRIAAMPQVSAHAAAVVLAVVEFALLHGPRLHQDPEPLLRFFFLRCLGPHFQHPLLATCTLRFALRYAPLLLSTYPSVLPQFFPVLLKTVAWAPVQLGSQVLHLLPAVMAPSSIIPLFHALVDLPAMVLAFEDLERCRAGERVGVGAGSSTFFKLTLPGDRTRLAGERPQEVPEAEAVLALMEGAFSGTFEGAAGAGLGGELRRAEADIAVLDAFTKDLTREENVPLGELLWDHEAVQGAITAALNAFPPSARLRTVLGLAPGLLSVYVRRVAAEAPEGLLCALLPPVLQRLSSLFPHPLFVQRTRPLCTSLLLQSFRRFPAFLEVLRRPVWEVINGALGSPARRQVAVQLCWAVGEYGGVEAAAEGPVWGAGGEGGAAGAGDTGAQLFELLELALLERLASAGEAEGACEAQLLCALITAMSKVATRQPHLAPRAAICLAKVAAADVDRWVKMRANECRRVLQEPSLAVVLFGTPMAGGDPTGGMSEMLVDPLQDMLPFMPKA